MPGRNLRRADECIQPGAADGGDRSSSGEQDDEQHHELEDGEYPAADELRIRRPENTWAGGTRAQRDAGESGFFCRTTGRARTTIPLLEPVMPELAASPSAALRAGCGSNPPPWSRRFFQESSGGDRSATEIFHREFFRHGGQVAPRGHGPVPYRDPAARRGGRGQRVGHRAST